MIEIYGVFDHIDMNVGMNTMNVCFIILPSFAGSSMVTLFRWWSSKSSIRAWYVEVCSNGGAISAVRSKMSNRGRGLSEFKDSVRGWVR